MSAAGPFRLEPRQPFLSNALADEYIALEEVDDDLWNIVYDRILPGGIDERNDRIGAVEL